MAKKPKAWDRLNMSDRLAWVESLARDGLTNREIAKRIGISHQTFYVWQKEHPEFAEAVARGKEVPDALVEKALFRAALGFKYTEEQMTPTGKVVEVERYQAPNTTAMIYYLKNRRPDKWRDKQEVEHSGKVGVEFDAKDALARKLDQLIQKRDNDTD